MYCIPAGWIWGDHGFLKNMGVVDIAGSGVVHLVGGSSGKLYSFIQLLRQFIDKHFKRDFTLALACAIMLGPRLGRYDNGIDPLPLGNPVNAIMGLFVLW